jgi:hypothetical protein
MPGYFSKAFLGFKHEIPHKKQYSPHPHVIPNYIAKAQFTEPEEDLLPLGKEKPNSSKQLQEPFSIMDVQSTAQYSLHLVHLPPNKQSQWQKHWQKLYNC